MGINYFVFGGKKSTDFNLCIQQRPSKTFATRNIVVQDIPGRNGSLIVDNGSFGNVTVTYDCFFRCRPGDVPLYARQIAAWLRSSPGYLVLMDSYDRHYYQLAYYSGELDVMQSALRYGTVTLTFSALPYRYRQDGRQIRPLPLSGQVYNPEQFEALPYIKLYGSGDMTLTCGGETWQLSGVDGYIEIDSQQMECYKGTDLQNTKISGTSYPQLRPGWTSINITGATSAEYIPRWCTI